MAHDSTPTNGESSEAEAFFLEYHWFIQHMASLAMQAEACCDDQGNFNVAHELWYFITSARDEILADPLGLMTNDQKTSVVAVCEAVTAVPEAARAWATKGHESLANMKNIAWERPRSLAKLAIDSLASVTATKDAYFEEDVL